MHIVRARLFKFVCVNSLAMISKMACPEKSLWTREVHLWTPLGEAAVEGLAIAQVLNEPVRPPED